MRDPYDGSLTEDQKIYSSPWPVHFNRHLKEMMMDSELTRLRPIHRWHEYHVQQGGSLFPTFASLKWFVRNHKVSLQEAGVLVPGKGSRCTLVTSKFGFAVYDILVRGKKPDPSTWSTNNLQMAD